MTQVYAWTGDRVLVAGGQIYAPGNQPLQDVIREAFEVWLERPVDLDGNEIKADPARDYHIDIMIDQFLLSRRAVRVDYTQPPRKTNTRRLNVQPDGENVQIN